MMPSSTSSSSFPKLSSWALVNLKIEPFYFLDEGRGEREGEPKREESSVERECNLRLARLILFFLFFFPFLYFPFLSPSAAHEAWYAPAGSLSRRKLDGSTGAARRRLAALPTQKEISGKKLKSD